MKLPPFAAVSSLFATLAIAPDLVTAGPCAETDRLCLVDTIVPPAAPFTVFFYTGSFPVVMDTATLSLALFQGDLQWSVPLSDACEMEGHVPLAVWSSPLDIGAGDGPTTKTIKVSLPADRLPAIGEASRTENRFFFQLYDPTRVACLMGPFTGGQNMTSISFGEGWFGWGYQENFGERGMIVIEGEVPGLCAKNEISVNITFH